MNQPRRADLSVMTDSEERRAETARAAARDDSKPAPRIPPHTRLLLSGFFVLIALIIAVPNFSRGSIEYGLPNDALAAVILPAGSPARDFFIRLVPSLGALQPLARYEVAIVALNEPFVAGFVVRLPHPEDLLALSRAGLPATPLPHRLAALGDPTFGARLREGRRLPWWIRWRAKAAGNRQSGTLLLATTAAEPWLIGSLDTDHSAVRLTLPLPTPIHETGRLFESTIQEVLLGLAPPLLPVAKTIRLPDNTVVQELRQEVSAFSWSRGENSTSTYVLLQNNKPVFSYERSPMSDDCSDKTGRAGVLISTHPPLPKLKFGISLLKQAILFCLFDGDKL